MGRLPRILIVTAGYGEGHNSAARGLAAALEGRAEVLVTDPCAEGAPELNEVLRRGYRTMTTYSPAIWDWVYRAAERHDFTKETFDVLRKPEGALAEKVEQFQPDGIISTYPLYPYFTERLRKRGKWKGKVFTVVTDSININNAWLQAPTDYWLVTDGLTRRMMVGRGIPEEKVVETGFPVSPVFRALNPLTSRSSTDPFKVLYFTTGRKPQISSVGHPVLECPGTHLTLILGSNVRRLYRSARELEAKYPGRVRILGWSRKIPTHLCQHHLAIGKAGGATVHECIAASTPMLIHHLVPGQEEGNLELLRSIGGGDLADSPEKLKLKLQELLANDCKGWKRWKRNLAKASRPQSATITAQFVLEKLAE
ncbi:MAG: MGDG synthase family glycosyltransferase [Roseibacillus sp.]